jgi:hypothetical protein
MEAAQTLGERIVQSGKKSLARKIPRFAWTG